MARRVIVLTQGQIFYRAVRLGHVWSHLLDQLDAPEPVVVPTRGTMS